MSQVPDAQSNGGGVPPALSVVLITPDSFDTLRRTIDCIVRLSKPVNSKSGPARSAALKAALRAELTRLLQSQSVTGVGQ